VEKQRSDRIFSGFYDRRTKKDPEKRHFEAFRTANAASGRMPIHRVP
jgi:hypothetical protein